jgi:hypothetical protein
MTPQDQAKRRTSNPRAKIFCIIAIIALIIANAACTAFEFDSGLFSFSFDGHKSGAHTTDDQNASHKFE